MRRREALLLYAAALAILFALLLAEIRMGSEPVNALLIACVTALACGALALPLLRPLLLQSNHRVTGHGMPTRMLV